MLEANSEILRLRAQWRYRGQRRPDFARAPGPGQESVWDYPRPPRIAPDARRVLIEADGRPLAESSRTVRVLETAAPPTFYLPPEDVQGDRLVANGSRSVCEWKGMAIGFDLVGGAREVAWSYPETFPEFAAIAGWLAFYPARVACFVDGERVQPQPGRFYGGWITSDVVGPFKGEPGTAHW